MYIEKIKVDEEEKTLTPRKLFYNWFAANIGIMGIVFGAMIVSYHLSFFQATLASIVGAMSFAIPGWVAVLGKKSGITTFKMSRAAYGINGNKIPNVIAWINMVGWLAVNVITGTLLIVSLFGVLNITRNLASTAFALIIFATLVILSGLFKDKTLGKIQTWISYIFGSLTVIILIIFMLETNWRVVLAMPSGQWLGGFWPAVSIVSAGSGISWSMAAADWGAYVKAKNSTKSVFWNTTMGGAVPLFILMFGGVLLSSVESSLASASNPIDVMYHSLPSWLSVIYFLVAAGGLIPQCIISLRSARINLNTIGINFSKRTSLIIHGTIVILIPVYVLFISEKFLSNFELFLSFLGIFLAAWVAIFLCDNVLFRKSGYKESMLQKNTGVKANWTGIISWIISVIIGLLFTNNAIWDGPFANGVFRNNSLGVFISAISAIVLMLIFRTFKYKGPSINVNKM